MKTLLFQCCPYCHRSIIFPLPWAIIASTNTVDVEEQENFVLNCILRIIGNSMYAGI